MVTVLAFALEVAHTGSSAAAVKTVANGLWCKDPD